MDGCKTSNQNEPRPEQNTEPSPDLGKHPPPEEKFGGGDICSPEQEPPTEDDQPLD